MEMNAEALLQLYRANTLFLRWALLAWIVSIAVSLGLDETFGPARAETLYQIVALVGLLGLGLFGLLNVYVGVIRNFSAAQILITSAALFIAGVGIAAVFDKQDGPGLAIGGALFLAGMSAVRRWQARQAKPDAAGEVPARPMDDASIRGGASLFQYGHDAYRFVERNSTGRNTPAERFEKRLIRYIERKLDVRPISMKGSNASYWAFRLKSGGRVELVVIGPGYNTSAKLREDERWLLRIREAKPGFFANWMAGHFPPGAGMTRDLGAEVQHQLPSSKVPDERKFFDQDIEVPVLGVQLSPETAIGLMDYLEPAKADADREAATAEQPVKPTLH
jgi:hypothetical protein